MVQTDGNLVLYVGSSPIWTRYVVPKVGVVAWSQHDPRWANVTLGPGGPTMTSAGCAVTACAMLASYYGSGKDPGQLCSACSFASGGAIYWGSVPAAAGGTISGPVANLSGPNLSRIKSELDAGFPVIVHIQTSTVASHYVLITGHDGDTYYMNDPGYGDAGQTVNSRYGDPSSVITQIVVYHGQH